MAVCIFEENCKKWKLFIEKVKTRIWTCKGLELRLYGVYSDKFLQYLNNFPPHSDTDPQQKDENFLQIKVKDWIFWRMGEEKIEIQESMEVGDLSSSIF